MTLMRRSHELAHETLIGGDDVRVVLQSKGEVNTIVDRMACLRREL